jgi:hypothetical protein
MIEQPKTVLKVEAHQALVAVPIVEDGKAMTLFFVDEDEAAAVLPQQVQRALSLAGAWSDLDREETEAALERIRHESKPTPPIDEY